MSIASEVRVVQAPLLRYATEVGWEYLSAEDALRLLSAHPEIGLLFADVRMPGMDGAALAREAQRLRPDLKVVLTSGWVDNAGIGDFPLVQKPLGMGVIAGLMRTAGIRPRQPAGQF